MQAQSSLPPDDITRWVANTIFKYKLKIYASKNS
jgi:hypothetical protein